MPSISLLSDTTDSLRRVPLRPLVDSLESSAAGAAMTALPAATAGAAAGLSFGLDSEKRDLKAADMTKGKDVWGADLNCYLKPSKSQVLQ